MTEYVLFFLSIILYSFFGFFNNKDKFKKLNTIFIFFVFLSISSLRNGIGFDWEIYKNFFVDSNHLFSSTRFEKGFVFFNFFIRNITDNFNVYLFFYTFIALIFIYKFIDYFSTNIYYSFFIYAAFYFFGNIMGQMRQGMAMSILAFSVIYIYKEKYIKSFVAILIASLFHKISLIFLPFLLINFIIKRTKFLNRNNLLFLSVFFVIIGRTSIIKNLIYKMSSFFSVGTLSYAFSFINSEYSEQSSLMGFFERFLFLMFIILFLKTFKDSKEKIIILMYIINSFIYFLFFNISIYAMRFSSLYKISDIIIIPLIMSRIKNKYLKTIFFLLSIIFILYRIYSVFMNQAGNYIPYRSII